MSTKKTATVAGATMLLFGLSLWVLFDYCAGNPWCPGRYYSIGSEYIAVVFLHVASTVGITALFVSILKFVTHDIEKHYNIQLSGKAINVEKHAAIAGIIDLFYWTTFNMCVVALNLFSVEGLVLIFAVPVTISIVVTLPLLCKILGKLD